MAATPDIIREDLTLEIGDDPSPERFMQAASHFFGYIAEICKLAAPSGTILRWVVRVREGSDLIALAPDPTMPEEWAAPVYEQAARKLDTLIAGGIDAAALPERALQHLNALSKLTRGPSKQPTRIRLWIKRKPVVVDDTIAELVSEDERLGYSDYGTVEGVLDTIQDTQGLQFRVRDVALGLTVKCYIAEEQLPIGFEAFRKRVEVSGVIYYNKKGVPRSIRAERIEKLPGDDELPGLDELRGIFHIA